MNMRKKEILATLVMLTLMQGSVYAEIGVMNILLTRIRNGVMFYMPDYIPNSHLEKRVAEQCMLEIN